MSAASSTRWAMQRPKTQFEAVLDPKVSQDGAYDSRKTLLPVQLTYSGPKQTTPTCPSCTKELSNATSSFLLSSRKPAVGPDSAPTDDEPPKKKKKSKKDDAPYVCGHVVCKNCADTIVKPTNRCCVCEAEVEASGLIALGKEGEFACAGSGSGLYQGLDLQLRADQRSKLIGLHSESSEE